MDCRNFLRTVSSFALLAAGATTGIFRVFAETPPSSLTKIEVYLQYLDEYINYATEVGEISLRTEPGVLTMYAIGEKENPCKVTILETYASRKAYEKHIASEHFQKYKLGTLHMVKSLVLSDQTPLNPANKLYNFIK